VKREKAATNATYGAEELKASWTTVLKNAIATTHATVLAKLLRICRSSDPLSTSTSAALQHARVGRFDCTFVYESIHAIRRQRARWHQATVATFGLAEERQALVPCQVEAVRRIHGRSSGSWRKTLCTLALCEN
jgi:hypothetical protein